MQSYISQPSGIFKSLFSKIEKEYLILVSLLILLEGSLCVLFTLSRHSFGKCQFGGCKLMTSTDPSKMLSRNLSDFGSDNPEHHFWSYHGQRAVTAPLVISRLGSAEKQC